MAPSPASASPPKPGRGWAVWGRMGSGVLVLHRGGGGWTGEPLPLSEVPSPSPYPSPLSPTHLQTRAPHAPLWAPATPAPWPHRPFSLPPAPLHTEALILPMPRPHCPVFLGATWLMDIWVPDTPLGSSPKPGHSRCSVRLLAQVG